MKDYQSTGPHWTYGWLRRMELDSIAEGFCYEAPNGDLIYSLHEDHSEIMMLFEVIDDNGEPYLCDRPGIML